MEKLIHGKYMSYNTLTIDFGDYEEFADLESEGISQIATLTIEDTTDYSSDNRQQINSTVKIVLNVAIEEATSHIEVNFNIEAKGKWFVKDGFLELFYLPNTVYIQKEEPITRGNKQIANIYVQFANLYMNSLVDEFKSELCKANKYKITSIDEHKFTILEPIDDEGTQELEVTYIKID